MASFFKGKSEESQKVEHWYEERVGRVTLQRNFLIVMSLGVLLVLVLSVFTLFAVSTSRTIEPFVIEVSKKSGIVTHLDPATVKEYSANRAITNYFATQYVKAREVFHPATYRYDYYTTVRVFSSPEVYSFFKSSLDLDNPASPLNAYSDVVDSKYEIRSIRHLDKDTIQIRISISFATSNGRVRTVDRLISLGYTYMDLELSEEDRQLNPLGFVVVSFQVDDDRS
ncbi:virB8 family protein [Neorickettsia helminthoeca str. Oregon]|uniref:VirB8 family protein n=1 Tax=Neorickettsia helminthoeca str. Oregon TaxID=1286528 RepID=X5H4L2_9RICK|nr:type IV secretion system protein [Neorickettsia helminthoeca]AHX11638.1 virB8 family protein [Neorickettsia helminthoeca str. Oregon]